MKALLTLCAAILLSCQFATAQCPPGATEVVNDTDCDWVLDVKFFCGPDLVSTYTFTILARTSQCVTHPGCDNGFGEMTCIAIGADHQTTASPANAPIPIADCLGDPTTFVWDGTKFVIE